MGFIVSIDEDKDEVIVTLGDDVVSKFNPKGLKEGLKADLESSDGDYLQFAQ